MCVTACEVVCLRTFTPTDRRAHTHTPQIFKVFASHKLLLLAYTVKVIAFSPCAIAIFHKNCPFPVRAKNSGMDISLNFLLCQKMLLFFMRKHVFASTFFNFYFLFLSAINRILTKVAAYILYLIIASLRSGIFVCKRVLLAVFIAKRLYFVCEYMCVCVCVCFSYLCYLSSRHILPLCIFIV